MLVYLHMPKTAGTTLRMIIEREYGLSRIVQVDGLHKNAEVVKIYGLDRLNNADVISGHQYFGLHKIVDSECKYITMLRDPVDRALSAYSHINMQKDRCVDTLLDFMEHKQGKNFQTRLIAGGEANLDLAIDNINRSFLVAGISEMFDESILLMQHKMLWTTPYYVIENPSHNRIQKYDLDEDIIEIIKHNNSLDIALYGFCTNKLKEEINILGDNFKDTLNRFKIDNTSSNIDQRFVGPGFLESQATMDIDTLLPVNRTSK